MSPPIGPTTPQWAIPRATIVLLGLASAVIAIAGLKAVAGIFSVVFLAFMIAIGVAPLGNWLRNKGAPGWFCGLGLIFAAFGILIGFALIITYAVVELARIIPTYDDQFNQLMADAQEFLSNLGVTERQIDNALDSLQLSDITGYLVDIFGAILSVLGNFGFMLIVLFFVIMDLSKFNNRLAVSRRLRPDAGYALSSFVHGTRNYLVISTVFGAIVAVIDAAALWLLGLPSVVVWGLISFVTNYIPNIGFVLGVIPPALIGLLQGGPSLMLIVIAVYSGINFVIQSLIQPRFVGDSVNLATTVTLLSMTMWTWIIGPLGALLAIPLTLLIRAVLIEIDPSTRWIGLLLESGTPTEADIEAAQAAEEAAGLAALPMVVVEREEP